MRLVKTRYAYLTVISVVALLGLTETTRADVFTTANFSGTINLDAPLTLPPTAATPAIGGIFSLNYTGTPKFDQTQVNNLGNKLQVYKNFIPDGGSVSLTLFTPFGNFPFASSNSASIVTQPTLVVWNKDAVGFDYDMKNTVNGITLDLNVNAPIPNPQKTPPSGTSYEGVLENITLSLSFDGFKEILKATTTPRFTVIPEPSTMLLLGLGASILTLTLLPRRHKICA
jgi:hypothetical protein